MSTEKQVVMIYAGTSGALDDVPANKVAEFEKRLLERLSASNKSILEDIATKKVLSDENKEALKKAIANFKSEFLETLNRK
jgi:F-type H+-transporting ATPase subunit alpha